MAKVGLNFGEKLQIADKQYRVLNDGLADLKQIFGKMVFLSVEGQDVIYEEDRNQPPRQGGIYPQVPTGEIRVTVFGENELAIKVENLSTRKHASVCQGNVRL